MAYLIDRQRALRGQDLVAIVTGTRRGERSRVTLKDNSLHRTASRVRAFAAAARRYPAAIIRRAQRTRRGAGLSEPGRSRGATWRKRQ